LDNGHPVCLITVNGDTIWPAMPDRGFANEAFSCSQITIFAEVKLDRISIVIDSAVQIHPLAFDLDVGLVQVPFAGNLSLSSIKAAAIWG
jgi:hypothetical protein